MSRYPANVSIRVISLILGILLITLLAACGGSSDSDEQEHASEPASAGVAPVTGAAAESADEESRGSGADTFDANLAAAADRMVIRSASIYLRVDDVAAAVVAVRDMAAANGGFVFSSSAQSDGDTQRAQITIRVPADRYEDTLNQLRSAAWVDRVDSEESTSQDVSGEYVDNESQLRTLRETQSRLLDLLSRADTVDDILRLEMELQNIRGDIERIQGRQQYLDNATAYSTISVSMLPAGVPASASGDGFSLSALLERGWDHARGAVEAIIVVATTLGILAVFVAPFALAAFIIARRVRGSERQTPAS